MNPRELLPRSLWLAPLGLSLIFVLGVLAWVWANEADERDQLRQTLISDALSTEAQLRGRIEDERAQLRQLAAALRGQPRNQDSLESRPEVNAGLRRLWQSVTWLDGRNRVLAEVPPVSEAGAYEDGLSLHLTAPTEGEGTLVVRYAPALLLKRGVPWWLARKSPRQTSRLCSRTFCAGCARECRRAASRQLSKREQAWQASISSMRTPPMPLASTRRFVRRSRVGAG